MIRNIFILVLFVSTAALSACGTSLGLMEDVPVNPVTPSVVQVPRTLLVLPVIGGTPTHGHELAQKVAWGLREAGYPARVANVADGTSPVLAGWVEEASSGGDVVWLNFDWAIYTPSGKLAGTHRQEMAISRDGWENLSTSTIAVIVTESVPSIHELVEGRMALKDRTITVPSNLMTPSYTEDGVNAETIIVSSGGLSRVTAEGKEVAEQSISVFATPPNGGQGTAASVKSTVMVAKPVQPIAIIPSVLDVSQKTAIEIVSNITAVKPVTSATTQDPLPTPIPAESPTLKIDTISTADLTTGTSSGTTLPSVSDIQQLSTGDSRIILDGEEIIPDPMGLDPALDEFEPAPGLLPDDTNILTPKTAALVTTDPELTLPEPIIPSPAAVAQPAQVFQPVEEVSQVEGLAQVAMPVAPVTANQVAPGVDGLPDYATPATSIQEQAYNSAALNMSTVTSQPVFMVHRAIGAPGDGNIALPLAMQQALRKADAAVTSDPSHASHIIQCSVLVETPFAGRQRTRIVWTVTDILGRETGSAVQENDVPQGSLDQSWVSVAPVIANAAIKGIRKLFVNGIERHGIGGGLLQPDLPHIQKP